MSRGGYFLVGQKTVSGAGDWSTVCSAHCEVPTLAGWSEILFKLSFSWSLLVATGLREGVGYDIRGPIPPIRRGKSLAGGH